MKKIMWLALFGTLSLTARAAEIAHVPLDLCATQPHSPLRDYWDRTGKFCANGGTWDYTAMPEIKLREKGQWINGEYAAALTDANRVVVAKYDTFYVRYFATRPGMNGKVEFVVHVYFSWLGGTQTIFVFGEVENGRIKLTGYSDSTPFEGQLRVAWNTAKNLAQAFNPEDQRKTGVEITRAQDRERIQPVTDVLNKYGHPALNVIKPLN